jgi:hypothetical protein
MTLQAKQQVPRALVVMKGRAYNGKPRLCGARWRPFEHSCSVPTRVLLTLWLPPKV